MNVERTDQEDTELVKNSSQGFNQMVFMVEFLISGGHCEPAVECKRDDRKYVMHPRVRGRQSCVTPNLQCPAE